MKSQKISVALATHNEEKNLARCLDAVKDFADEIVIADGESTDQTVKIAEKYGAKIIHTTNKANFHINKQLAFDQVKNPLVLYLDADEVVDAKLHAFIVMLQDPQKEKKSENDRYNAWWIRRKNWFMGRFLSKGGQYPDPVIRLYRNGKAKLPQKDVHEQMVVDGEIGWADGNLLHYGNPSFSDYLRKFNTYTSFKAEQLHEVGLKITLLHSFEYLFWKPTATFLLIYFRHKGFVDGLAGFVFAAFSGFHHFVAYLKLWEIYEKEKKEGGK